MMHKCGRWKSSQMKNFVWKKKKKKRKKERKKLLGQREGRIEVFLSL